jgi:hypothetical protein
MTDSIAVVNTVYLCKILDSKTTPNALDPFLYHTLVSPNHLQDPYDPTKDHDQTDPNHFLRCLPYFNSQFSYWNPVYILE